MPTRRALAKPAVLLAVLVAGLCSAPYLGRLSCPCGLFVGHDPEPTSSPQFPETACPRYNLPLADGRLVDLADLQWGTELAVGCDLQGVEWGRANLAGIRFTDCDLRRANLRGADLSQAVLQGTDLRAADLQGTNLLAASLRECVLAGANLRGALLRNTDLTEADLTGADLRGATLDGAQLGGADFRGADLREAELEGAFVVKVKTGRRKWKNVPNLRGARYDGWTRWPAGFRPEEHGARLDD